MKNKTLKRLLSLLLAIIVMVSLPLDLHANALAIESWMVYALITYMAAMGITFTVAGGVDAMIQAMEEKVKDYEEANNIIDFYEVLRNRNVRLVPNNNHGPDGNPLFDLFFTATAVEAIQSFVNWLTSEGGWGGENTYDLQYAYTFAQLISESASNDIVVTLTSIGEKDSYGFANVLNLGDVYSVDTVNQVKSNGTVTNGIFFTSSSSDIWSFNVNMRNTNNVPSIDYYRNYYHNGAVTTSSVLPSWSAKGFTYDNIQGVVFVKFHDTAIRVGLLMSDNTVYLFNNSLQTDVISLSTSVDIITPEELQEQFPSVEQGVSISDAISVPMGDPTLAEWAQRVEETFDLTGTIPQPVPQVVPDPEAALNPTPVPTPAPSPEIEDVGDLGLPTLGEAIFSKFPFSLPKDLKRISDILNAEPVPPKWEVDLYEPLDDKIAFRGDTEFTIDLEEYEELGQISRWASVISFVVFLIIITKGVIRW